MELTLTRINHLKDRTIGTLSLPDVWQCFTLEDKMREIDGRPVAEWKIPGVTAIPRGRYRIVLDMSARFGKVLPRLLDVPGFTGIRIHTGNTDEDTEGCILVGKDYDSRSTAIINSRVAMRELMDILLETEHDGEEIWITVS